MNRNAWLLLLGIALTGTGWTGSKTESGQQLRWDAEAITMFASAKGTADIAQTGELDAFEPSMRTWNDVPCGHPALLYGGTVPETDWGDDGTSLLTFSDLSFDAIAVTMTWYDTRTGLIDETDIAFNDPTYRFTVTEEPFFVVIDLQSVLTHELGHVLGLGHSARPDATMFWAYSGGSLSMRTLTRDDAEGLCAIYGGVLPAAWAPISESEDVGGEDATLYATGTPTLSTHQPRRLSYRSCAAGTGGDSSILSTLAIGLAVFPVFRWRRG